MSRSEETSTALRKDLHAHSRRIEELRRLVEVAEDEIAIHEAVLELGRNERIISAIEELRNGETDSRNEIIADFGRYCAQEGIPLPAEVTFVSAAAPDELFPLRAEVRRGSAVMEIIWAPDSGFVGRALIPQLSFIINAPSFTVSG
jgi:hypothetical protein